MTTPHRPTTSVQLYSFQRLPEYQNLPRLFERIKAIGFDAVEPVRLLGTPSSVLDFFRSMAGESYVAREAAATQLRRWLDEAGLKVSGAHVWLPFDDKAEAIFDEQQILGNDYLVAAGAWKPDGTGLADFQDLDTLKEIAQRFNIAADKARARGMRIGYHNHSEEFHHFFDERTAYDVFFDLVDPTVFAELDVYWATAGGADPVQLIEKYGERVQLLHVKDGTGKAGDPNTAVGQGSIDMTGVLAAGSHVSAYTVEFDFVDEIWSALADSYSFIQNHQS